MTKIYKYQIENELKTLKNCSFDEFKEYIDNLTLSENKIVFFPNTKSEYYSYYCTNCKTWHYIHKKAGSKFKKGEYLTCGNCNNRFEVINQQNKIDNICIYITKIEKNRRKELIFRIFFYIKAYNKKTGEFHEHFYEVSRYNLNRDIAMYNNTYMVLGHYGQLYHGPTRKKEWMRDRNGWFSCYPTNNLITKRIKTLIKNTEYRYSVADAVIKLKLDILDYLILYKQQPKLEMLVKMGCTKILKEICRRGSYENHNVSSILNRLDKDDMRMLKKENLGCREIEIYHTYKKYGVNNVEYIKKAIEIGIIHNLAGQTNNLKKDIDYLIEKKYNAINYLDYLRISKEMGVDLDNCKNRYPDDPRQAHDKIIEQRDEVIYKHIDEKIYSYSKELAKLSFKDEKLQILPAKHQQELVNESRKLKHCVRSYAKMIAKKETSIFFIRKNDAENEPYVTLELRSNKVVQCRGIRNNRPDNDVIDFVKKWCDTHHFRSCFDQ